MISIPDLHRVSDSRANDRIWVGWKPTLVFRATFIAGLSVDLASGSAEWGRPSHLAIASTWVQPVSGRCDGEAEGAHQSMCLGEAASRVPIPEFVGPLPPDHELGRVPFASPSHWPAPATEADVMAMREGRNPFAEPEPASRSNTPQAPVPITTTNQSTDLAEEPNSY